MENIIWFVLVGFVAQLIDGALGMAYGVSSNTFLLSLGVPPVAASASVHLAETFTTGVSGWSHWHLKNVDTTLVKRLLLPGVLGGVLGAYVLTNLDGNFLKPFISAYLLVMGLIILAKAIRYQSQNKPVKHLSILGLVGGFLDAIGGGGWGPVVTTTLIANGSHPRATIGSVNFTEFFVTLAQSITFVISLSFLSYWNIILGLLLGGMAAAPFAAYAAKKLPTRWMMGLVGIVIIFLSLRTLWLAWG